MRPPSRPVLLALCGLLVGLAVLAGVLVLDRDRNPSGPAAPSFSPVPSTLEQLASDAPTPRRTGFCERVEPARVEAVLGAPATTTEEYGNGETAVLGEGVEDVAHEHGCRWVAADGTEARAWVFVPPVSPGRAGRLVDLATGAAGCAVVPGASYGDPGVATSCTDPASGVVTTAYQGLFGDAWLSCTVRPATPTEPAVADQGSDPGRADEDRAARWCVAVAVAASE